jgi:hypothetical protein
MTALFMVRAEVNDPGDREAFDRWYEQEHLPQAAAAFQAIRAWRGWSVTNSQTSRLHKWSWIPTR